MARAPPVSRTVSPITSRVLFLSSADASSIANQRAGSGIPPVDHQPSQPEQLPELPRPPGHTQRAPRAPPPLPSPTSFARPPSASASPLLLLRAKSASPPAALVACRSLSSTPIPPPSSPSAPHLRRPPHRPPSTPLTALTCLSRRHWEHRRPDRPALHDASTQLPTSPDVPTPVRWNATAASRSDGLTSSEFCASIAIYRRAHRRDGRQPEWPGGQQLQRLCKRCSPISRVLTTSC